MIKKSKKVSKRNITFDFKSWISLAGIIISVGMLFEMRAARIESYRPNLVLKGDNLYLYSGEWMFGLDEYPIEWSKVKYNYPTYRATTLGKNTTATKYIKASAIKVEEPDYRYVSDLYEIWDTSLEIKGENIGIGTARDINVEWICEKDKVKKVIEERKKCDLDTHFWKLNGTWYSFLLNPKQKNYFTKLESVKPGEAFVLMVPNQILLLYSLYIHLMSKDPKEGDARELYENPLSLECKLSYKDIGGHKIYKKLNIVFNFRVNYLTSIKEQRKYREIFNGIAEGDYKILDND